jgi:SAM-dependent methyltransferase
MATLQGTGSVDAVVAFNGLASAGANAQRYFAEVARILKPGAPFVFIDRGEQQRSAHLLPSHAAAAKPFCAAGKGGLAETVSSQVHSAEHICGVLTE